MSSVSAQDLDTSEAAEPLAYACIYLNNHSYCQASTKTVANRYLSSGKLYYNLIWII